MTGKSWFTRLFELVAFSSTVLNSVCEMLWKPLVVKAGHWIMFLLVVMSFGITGLLS